MKIITTITMFSLSFCQGVLYLDYAVSADGEAEIPETYYYYSQTQTVDIDDTPISIGYYHPVYQIADNMALSVGGSYEVVPAKSNYDFEMGFMAVYGALGFLINEQVSAWGSLGLAVPTSDDLKDLDAEPGMHMGIGVSYSVNEQIGVSLGFVSNSTTWDGGDYYYDPSELELTVSKMILSVGYKL